MYLPLGMADTSCGILQGVKCVVQGVKCLAQGVKCLVQGFKCLVWVTGAL